jgi:hypothetical protein
MDTVTSNSKPVAYWYPQPYWSDHEAGHIKNLLPFFDHVAILLPNYMYGRHREANPWLVGPLEEMGLLRVLEPGEFVDQRMTSRLHEIVGGLLASGAFDDLAIPSSEYGYQELSRSRLGWDADLGLSTDLIDELTRRRLALPSADGVSVPLHPLVRTCILVVLSQLAPEAGAEIGLELLPVTPSRERISDLLSILRLPGMASGGQVVAIDTETVGLDLSAAPLDAVLEFREAHGPGCRAYMRNVREFVRTVSALDASEQTEALLDRQEELADAAAELRRTSRSYWRRPMARVAIGGAGAVVSLAGGGPLAAALAGLTALMEWEPRTKSAGAFSYLFEVQRSVGA